MWPGYTLHAADRLGERYGERRCSDTVLRVARSAIMSGVARYAGPGNNACSVWRLYVNRKHLRVVWCERTQTIVTVLPSRVRRRSVAAE